MQKDITILIHPDPNRLSHYRGDQKRLIMLSKNPRIKLMAINHFDPDEVKGTLVLDINGTTIFQYINICFKIKRFIRNVYLQDSYVRWNKTYLSFLCRNEFKWGKIFYPILQWSYYIINEVFFSIVLKKVGFITHNESKICDLLPIKVGSIPNAFLKIPQQDFEKPLKANELPRFFFYGNLGYGPNSKSLIHFLNNYWTDSNLALYGKIEVYGKNSDCLLINPNQSILEKVSIKGEFEDVKTLRKANRVFINLVEFGAGQKNKSQEAIINGIPMICHTHSARGIPELDNYPFLYHDKNSFYSSLKELLENFDKHHHYLNNLQQQMANNYEIEKVTNEYVDFFAD